VASRELQTFISTYPNSTYAPEAKELLVNVLANTNNYKDALVLYESLQGKSESVKRVYPKILYGRAVEYINEQQLVQADGLLNDVLHAPYNTAVLPYVYFWKGEIAYRLNNPDLAIEHLTNYLKSPATSGEVNVTNAKYDLGHAYMQKENYRQALDYFEQVSSQISSGSSAIEQDAYLRSADAHFMNRNYKQAQDMYDVVLKINSSSADYALYQKAIISGAAHRNTEKISQLQSLEQLFPSSSLVPDANLEIANTYLSQEDYGSAIAHLSKIVKDSNASALHPQGYLKLGVAYFNLENNQEALGSFKTLISSYPNSSESDAAVEYVRDIFIHEQKPSEFATFMRENGKSISYSEEDSITYASANIRFNKNDQQNALTGFKDYLNKFPNGRYTIDANYNIAEIYNGKKDYENALIGYAYVASKAPNKYAEKSVLQAARINFFELKNYTDAEIYFTQLKGLASQPNIQLEAMRGLLRSQYRLNQWKDAVPNAQELLTRKGIATDDKMMANMVIAKNYQSNNETDLASSTYKSVIALGKSEFAAEARYQIAYILFQEINCLKPRRQLLK
jgi:TolA-binding protein